MVAAAEPHSRWPRAGPARGPVAGGALAGRTAAAQAARTQWTPLRAARDARRHRDHDADPRGSREPGGFPQLVRHARIRGSVTREIFRAPKMRREGIGGKGRRDTIAEA